MSNDSEAQAAADRPAAARRSSSPGSLRKAGSLRKGGSLPKVRVASLYILLPGAYAWLTTVALPAFERETSSGVRIVALLALLPLLAGPVIARRQRRLGRRVGIWGFLGMSTLCWVLLGSALDVARLEPVRAALGSLGWALFALGWGSVRDVGHVPERDPHAIGGQDLRPRGRFPRLRTGIFALGVSAGIVPPLLAWRIVGTEQALFGHATALLAAIATVSVAAQVAARRPATYKPVSPPVARLTAASGPLTLLGLLLVIGVFLSLL